MYRLNAFNIDLSQRIPGSEYFTWYEALCLPSWAVHVFPSKSQYDNILEFTKKCDRVREFLDLPMIVTSFLRPREYNKQVGGARFSKHMEGRAMDFYCPGYINAKGCDKLRMKLKPKLKEFSIRMEDIKGDWIHIDDAEPGPGGRFFKP